MKRQIQSRAARSKRAGLEFPVVRIDRSLKNGNYAGRIESKSSVYMAAVLEYLTSEMLEIAGAAALENHKKRITPRHLELSIQNDAELSELLQHVTISEGGVVPHIESALLPRKTRPTAQSEFHPAPSQTY